MHVHIIMLTCKCLIASFFVQHTVHAMGRVGVPAEDQEAIFRTVSAVLSLGNISFSPGPDDSCVPSKGDGEKFMANTGGKGVGNGCGTIYR